MSSRRKPPSQRANRAPRPVRDHANDPNAPHLVAAHEAGHAVAAVVLGIDLLWVDTKQRPLDGGGVSLGYTKVKGLRLEDVDGKGADAARPWMIQALAGPVAEEMIRDLEITGGNDGDYRDAQRVAAAAVIGTKIDPATGNATISPELIQAHRQQLDQVMLDALEGAVDLIERHRHAVAIVATQLRRRQSLTGAEVAALVTASQSQPQAPDAVVMTR